jgi:lysophospholipase L1-like esterase
VRGAIVFHLLSGHAWFSAGILASMLLLADLTAVLSARPRARRVARVAFLLAIGVGALSGTPVRLALLAALLLALLAVLATAFRGAPTRTGRAASGAALAMILAALALEAPWHRRPLIDLPPDARVVVLGDSLASGGFGEAAPWPARLAGMSGLRVHDLSLPGETLRSAMSYELTRVREIGRVDLVIVELGGNDVLEGRAARDFARDLDTLLAAARAIPGARVLMVELPVLPGRWSHAAAQRRATRAHDAALLPKRVLARVLADPALAGDGLHPSDAGHEAIARAIAASLR